MKKILITGCAGFIGSHFTDLMVESGYEVIGVDNLSYAGKMDNMENVLDSPNFTFIKQDIVKMDNKYLDNVEMIVHFAAETHVDNSIKDVEPFIRNNIEGMKNILELCRDNNILLVNIGTDEVYGSAKGGQKFQESDALSPANPYSASKASAEAFMWAFHNTYDMSYLAVRCVNNFGPRQHEEKFIPTAIKALLNGEKIPVYGDGQNVRDWLYVKDCCKAIKFVIDSAPLNSTVNISGRNLRTNIDLAKKLCGFLNIKDGIKFVEDRKGHDQMYSVDNAFLTSMGFSTFSSFDESLMETIVYYRSYYGKK